MRYTFCFLISFISTTTFAAMPVNKEIKCDLTEMSFFVNGKQTAKNNPTNQEPVYYFYDGKRLNAYYKFATGPVGGNGAKFISREIIKSGQGRSFDVTTFEKSGPMQNRLQFFKEVSGKTTQLNLTSTYSDNNFISFGRHTSVCFID